MDWDLWAVLISSALAKIPDAEVIAVMSRNEKRLSGDLSDVQGNLDVPSVTMDFSAYRKYREVSSIIADPDIEAVDIVFRRTCTSKLQSALCRPGSMYCLKSRWRWTGTRLTGLSRRQIGAGAH
ncbi:MAG: hypothetical protein WKF37_05090 [Bryobacteraceae bacterium]